MLFVSIAEACVVPVFGCRTKDTTPEIGVSCCEGTRNGARITRTNYTYGIFAGKGASV